MSSVCVEHTFNDVDHSPVARPSKDNNDSNQSHKYYIKALNKIGEVHK